LEEGQVFLKLQVLSVTVALAKVTKLQVTSVDSFI
jgi:hypothetical protein